MLCFFIWWKFCAAYRIKFYLVSLDCIQIRVKFFNSTPHGCCVLNCFEFGTKRVLITEHVSNDTVQATAQQQNFLFYQHYPASRLGMCKRLGMKRDGTADLN